MKPDDAKIEIDLDAMNDDERAEVGNHDVIIVCEGKRDAGGEEPNDTTYIKHQ